MALRIQQQYTTQADALYNRAQGSKYFDDSAYAQSIRQDRGDEFILAVLGTEDTDTPTTFNDYIYNKLQGTDKLDYLSVEYYLDRNQTDTDEQGNTYNVYDKAMEYFDYQVEQIEIEEAYNNMSGFEKAMATIGTMIGEAANAVYGVVENLIDAVTLAGGALADVLTFGQFHEDISEGTKWAISQDLTGTGALGDALADIRHRYTAIDRNGFVNFLDNVIVGTAQMAPLFLPGGNVAYMASMAGMTARDAIQNNPDIDLLNLVTYVGATTAVEYGTEWLSGKIFGGADFIGSKLTGQAMRQSTKLINRLGLDFTSEFMEESISEFIGSALDVWLVGGPNSQYASFTDVLYAGLIGGTIGGLLSGANVATTNNYGVTKEGNLVDFKTAKAEGLDVKKISKIDTLNLQESLQTASQGMRANQVEEFYAKYQEKGLTRQQAVERHRNEYDRAVEQQQTQQKSISDAIAVMSKVMEWGGEDAIVRGINLANATIEQKSRLIREFTEYTPSTKTNIANVEKRLNDKTPGSKASIIEDLNASQLKIRDEIKSKFGVDVYYANYAEQDGNVKNHNVVIDENTIVLDNNMFENADYDYIINKIAKQMLVRTLQYDSGVLNTNNIKSLKMTLSKQPAYNESQFDTVQYLDTTDVDTLSQKDLQYYADKQAELLSQMLLFDQFTVNTVFIGNSNIFIEMYSWLKKTADFFRTMGKKDDLNKIQFNQVLKSMRLYENSVVQYSPSTDALLKTFDEMQPDEYARKRMTDSYDESTKPQEFKDWGFIPETSSNRYQSIYQCRMDLQDITNGQFTYEDAFNPDIYPSDFIAEISANQNQGDSFEYILQEYLLRNYGLQIDQKHRQLVEAIHFRDYSTNQFKTDLDKVYKNEMSLEEFQSRYKTVGDLFNTDFNEMLFNEDTGERLTDVDLYFVRINRAEHPGNYGYEQRDKKTNRQRVVVYIDNSIVKTNDRITEFAELEHTIYHETQHIIADWTNLPAGGSSDLIAYGLLQQKQFTIEKLMTKMSRTSYRQLIFEGASKLDIVDEIAEKIYTKLAGERLASGDKYSPSEIFGDVDVFDVEYMKNTFRITGYGRYSGIMFEGSYPEGFFTQARQTSDQNQLSTIQGNTTEEFKKLLNKRYWKNDLKKLLDIRDYEENNQTYVSGVGDIQATNEAIRLLYPDNQYATSIEYVDNIIRTGLAYAETYMKIHPSQNVTESHTFDEIKQDVDSWLDKQDTKTVQDFWNRQALIENSINDWKTSDGTPKSRRNFLNKDYNYSISQTSEILRDLRLETGIRSIQTVSESELSRDEDTPSLERQGTSFEIEFNEDNFLELEDADAANVLQQAFTKVSNSINTPEAFSYITAIQDYEKTLVSEDKQRVQNELDERLWYNKTEYEAQIRELKSRLDLVNNLTSEEREIINTDTNTFTTPQQYIDYINDLGYILSEHPTTEQQVKQVIKETAPEVRETATEKAKETAKKTTIKSEQRIESLEEYEEKYNKKKQEWKDEEERLAKKMQDTVDYFKKEVVKNKRKKSATQIEKEKRRAESKRVKEQTIPRENLNINDENRKKVDELKKMMTKKGISEYQGDRFTENESYTKATQEIVTENREFFENLTANDLQSMLNILQVEDFEAPYEEMQLQTAAYNLLIRYAYDHRKQFSTIRDWINRKYQLMSTSRAQFMGGLSATYGRHSVKSLLTEMEQLNNQTLNLPNEIIEATITDGTPIEQFKTSLLERSDELEKQIKEEKDPQKKWELRREQSYIDNLYNALEDGDYALALDLFTEHLNELDEYQTQNQERIAETYKQIVDFLVQNIDGTGRFRTKKQSMLSPETKAKLVKAWSGIKSFRYLCMLSSPTTMGRNALSNTAVATQAIVEDLVSKGLEHIPSMYEATSQIKYTGDFDKAFSDYVDETYSNRINKDTNGDKYNSREKDTLRAEYAKEKDPLRKNKILGWIKRLEEKGLNDKRWTRRRVKRNLKNMLAGAHNQILWSAETALATRYKVKIDRQNSDYRQQLIDKIAKTNPELADLYSRAISSDTAALTSIIQLGNKLHLDIMEQIYQKALYRANKLFFKIDNWFSRTESNLRRTHPFAAEILNIFQPFIRVSANTTIYTIDRSPIGLVKGLVKYLQTRQMVLSDMQQEIRNYYEKEYVKQNKKNNKEFKFEENAFMEWMTSHSDAETMRAINGDKTAIKNVAQRLLDNGFISHMSIGADNIFARGEAIESISQGMVGTSLMVVGMILAAVLDGFDYEDDDDYLGPILRIGDIKIRLTDLAPFSTLFVVGAMLGSDRVDNKFETIFSVIADQTLLNVVESALTYSNSLTDYLENQTINTLQSFIPAITKNIAKVWGNKKDKSGNFIDKLWKTTLSNTMFFNFLVADKINPYTGEPEKYYESGILEGIYNLLSPIAVRVDVMSNFEREATRLGATTTGTSGNFTINGTDYSASGKLKEQLGVFRADYINNEFDKIVNGRQTVTVEDEDGNYITTTYDKLTDKQKTNVIKRLYTKASEVTKIQYWLSGGSKYAYVVTNRDLYNTYRNLFNPSQLAYKTSWSGSKFITR